jgi:hypothetical protein
MAVLLLGRQQLFSCLQEWLAFVLVSGWWQMGRRSDCKRGAYAIKLAYLPYVQVVGMLSDGLSNFERAALCMAAVWCAFATQPRIVFMQC